MLKNYKSEDQPVLPAPSDLVYQMWQAFIAARKANAGDPLAQHELGLRYLFGRGVDVDTQKAAFWIEKAAEQNLLPARFNLGILDYHGWGVPWNPFETFREFQYCASNGMPEAELGLAQLYVENLVVPSNRAEAYAWARKAAEAGYKPAIEALKDFPPPSGGATGDSTAARSDSTARDRSAPPPVGVLTFPQEAAEDTVTTANAWVVLKNAMRSAGPEMKAALGMSKMLDSDLDVDSVSFRVITTAAENGSPEALSIVARCYEHGIGVPRDVVKAASCYVRALRMDAPRAGKLLWDLAQEKEFCTLLKQRSSAGDPVADFAWAGLVALGYDAVLAQNDAYLTDPQALRLLEKAAEAHNLEAIVELGLCYYGGRWVAGSEERALALWKEAAAEGSREAQIRLAVTAVRSVKSGRAVASAIAVLSGAVQDGSVLAEVALGYCYDTGTGVPRNAGTAAQFYLTAARRGSQDAYRALRRMYDDIRPKAKEFQIEG